MTRGYRNNNPGNIRLGGSKFIGEVVGSDTAFRTFASMDYGYRAMFKLLHNYIDKGFDTITKIISRWAPPSENNTAAYIQSVVKQTGINAGQLIVKGDRERLIKIVGAISTHENGTPPNTTEVQKGFDLLKYNTWDKKKAYTGGGLVLTLALIALIIHKSN